MPAFRRSARVLGMGLVALLATGCSAATATQNGSTPSQQAGRGVSGTITSASTSTLQVQSAATGSAAIVTFTPAITITDAVPGTLADVKPGLCITARAASSTASAVATPAAGTPLVAATVSLFEPTNGSCTGGTGGNGGGTRTANPSFTPSARPSANPSRTPGAGFAQGAVGTVTSVSGSTIVIATTGFAQGGQTPTPGTATVTTTAQTVVTKRETGTAASLKTGRCVVAIGATDAAGVTTATQLSVSDPVDGQCTMTGRGGFGGNRG
jgi:hypothetical protein